MTRVVAVAAVLAPLALSLASLWALLDDPRAWRRTVLAVGAATAAWAFLVAALLTDDRLAPFVTVLHEGRSERTLRAFFGADDHVGPLWRAAAAALARPGHVPVLDVVRGGLVLAGAAAAGLSAVAARASGRPWAAAVAFALFVSSRGFGSAALSETPSAALWCLALAAAPAWALLDGARRPRRHLLLALATLALCTAEAACLRPEFALLGAPFVALAAVAAAGRPGLPDVALALARRAAGAVAVASWPVRLAVLGLLAAVPSAAGLLDFRPRVLVRAALPFTADLVHAPIALLATTPLPVVALAVVGAAAGLRRSSNHAALSVAVASMLVLDLTASHGVGWEMFRYAAMLAAPVWLLAVLGWREVERRAASARWPSTWRWWCAALSLLLGLESRRGPSTPGWWDDDARLHDATSAPSDLFVSQSKQRAARFLLRHLRQSPRCVFVERVRLGGDRDGEPILAVFGVGVGLTFVPAGTPLREAARATGAPCARYYWSLDCNMREGPSCDADVAGARPLEVWHGRHAVYSDSVEYGPLMPEISLGVWSLD